MNDCVTVPGFDPGSVKDTLNRWIVTSLSDTIAEIEQAIADYRFNDAGASIYHFVWNTYCDWYVELVKPILQGADDAAKAEARATTAHVRDEILKLLHPFMPFVTEELWRVTAEVGPARASLLALARWPERGPSFGAAAEEINWLIDLVSKIRSVRAEMNVPAATQVRLVLVGGHARTRAWLSSYDAAIKRLARVSSIEIADKPPPASAQIITADALACLPLQGIIDFAAEKARLEKEMARVKSDIARIDAKLGNADFVGRAPEEVVEGEREKREEAETRRRRIGEALERLKGAA
jgi:valyl-tRNA synthetase